MKKMSYSIDVFIEKIPSVKLLSYRSIQKIADSTLRALNMHVTSSVIPCRVGSLSSDLVCVKLG